MKSYLILMLLILFKNTEAQQILAHEQWRYKIDEAVKLIKNTEPDLYGEVITRAYIQVATCAQQGMTAFATKDFQLGKSIEWIIIDTDAIRQFSIKGIASLIVHEALHLKLWDHGGTGKTWGVMSSAEQHSEHSYIYNYQLSFLTKLNAEQKDIAYFSLLMKQLGIKINPNTASL